MHTSNIELDGIGTPYIVQETIVSFVINNQGYDFMLIEKENGDSVKESDYDFISENKSALPFELTDEIKEQMYELCNNERNK